MYAINKTNRGTSIATFKSHHYYLHNTNTLVCPGHSCAKANGNSTYSISALNFRSQATCPVQPGDSEGSLPTRLPLGLDKFQLFKRCSLHLQLFPHVEQVSPTSFIRHLKEQANTKHMWGGRRYGHTTHTNKISPPHLNTYFHETQRSSLSLRS